LNPLRGNIKKTERTPFWLVLLSILLASVIFLFDLSVPLGVAAGVPYVVLVLGSLWSPKKQYTFLMATVGTLLTLLGFFFSPPGGEMWKVIFNRVLALFIIWITTILSLQRKRTNEALYHKSQMIQLLQEIAVTANEARTVREAMQICLDKVCSYTGWPVGHVYMHDSSGDLISTKIWSLENPQQFETFRKITEATSFARGEGLPGRVLANGKPAWITDVTKDLNFPRVNFNKSIGVKAGFAFPVLEGKKIVAILEFFSDKVITQDEFLLNTISNLATQLGRVTERKRSEESLRISEERLHAINCSVNDAIIMINGYGKVSYWNPAAEKIFGFSSHEFLHMELHKSIIPERYCESFLEGLVEFRKTGKAPPIGDRLEFPGLRKNGDEFSMELSLSSININDRWYALGIIHDITKRKKMEEVLRMLNNAIEQTMEMVIITNEEGIVEYINPAVEKITGYSKEEFIGFNPRLLKSDKHDNRFYKNMWDMIKAGDIWKGQLVNKKKSGELYDEEMTISPVQNAHGKITNFIAIKRDISETKNLQQQLIQAEKLSSMGTFVSGVAHELNNPLSSILGFAQSLATKNNLPTEMMNMIKIIEQESKRAAVIVHDLLRFSKKQTSGKTPLIINDVLARVLNLQTYHFHKESLEVKTDYSKAPLTIKGDINQLQQVFINIIVNAHYEMTKANVKGVLSIKSEKKEKDVLISIENNGPPIEEDHLNKIFDPFFSTKRIGKGTGLGLSISYGIIKDHGGKIWAENVGDSGVRFLIALPLVFDEAKKLIPQSKNLLLPKDIQIFLAYEDEDVHRSIMSVFSKEGLSAQSAKNGKKAENLLELNNFDVILSDVQLPRMEGLKLGKWLKRNKPKDLQKFVILTGIIDKKIADYCEKFNCEYLIKPVKKEGLIEIIRKIIQRNA